MKNAALYLFSNKFRALHSVFHFGLFAYKSSIALESVNVLLTNFSPLRNFAILILLRSMLVLFLSFEILHFIKRLVFGINLYGHGCELKE